jgi:N-acetylmuramoyl-L-alanine amidase CwlA
MSASAHAFIDDKDIIICVPCLQEPEKAWHVRYNVPNDNTIFGCNANDNAIGLELCYFRDDMKRSEQAYDNYINFAAYLAKHHNVNPTKRVGHFELDPARRSDPNNGLQYIGKTYDDMKKDIINKYNELYGNKKENQDKVKNQTVSKWSKTPQQWVIDNNISDGQRPKDIATREEIWTMLYRMNEKNNK